MSLLQTPTTLAHDLDKVDDSVIAVAQAFNYAAQIAAQAHSDLWRLPMDRLLAVLNDNVALTALRFQTNETLALTVNPILDSLKDHPVGSLFTARIPAERGNPYVVFDETTGKFIDTTPAPEPLPEEQL